MEVISDLDKNSFSGAASRENSGNEIEKKKDFFRGFDIKREKKNFLEVLLLRERKK